MGVDLQKRDVFKSFDFSRGLYNVFSLTFVGDRVNWQPLREQDLGKMEGPRTSYC